jgi:hypothetical protein
MDRIQVSGLRSHPSRGLFAIHAESGNSPGPITPALRTEIRQSLVLLLDAARRSDGASVAREMERLDAILERARASLPGQLEHFLGRRSYAKALAWLDANPDEAQGAH